MHAETLAKLDKENAAKVAMMAQSHAAELTRLEARMSSHEHVCHVHVDE